MDRIVIDKCYTILDSHLDFQPKMKEARGVLVKQGVQMVYLTAILCLGEEQEFMQIMKVQIPP